jgi:hypothetical protein
MVLADVLPPPDTKRAAAVLRLLQEVAEEGCQLIVLTRSPSHREACAALDIPAMTLEVQVARLGQRVTREPSAVPRNGDTPVEPVWPAPPPPPPAEEPYEVIGPVPLEQAGEELRKLYPATLPSSPTGAFDTGPQRETTSESPPSLRRLRRPAPEPSPHEETAQVLDAETPRSEPDDPPSPARRLPQSTEDELPDWWPD